MAITSETSLGFQPEDWSEEALVSQSTPEAPPSNFEQFLGRQIKAVAARESVILEDFTDSEELTHVDIATAVTFAGYALVIAHLKQDVLGSPVELASPAATANLQQLSAGLLHSMHPPDGSEALNLAHTRGHLPGSTEFTLFGSKLRDPLSDYVFQKERQLGAFRIPGEPESEKDVRHLLGMVRARVNLEGLVRYSNKLIFLANDWRRAMFGEEDFRYGERQSYSERVMQNFMLSFPKVINKPTLSPIESCEQPYQNLRSHLGDSAEELEIPVLSLPPESDEGAESY